MQTLDGRYRLEELRGTGGMAEVWRAYDEVLGRDVAVKLLTPELAGDQAARDRSYAEARAAAALAHPNITSVFDFGMSLWTDGETVPYIVMELLDGETLTERLADGALAWRRALAIGADIAAALAAAHAAGVVHRDVKPANVMLTTRGVKVLDFGISGLVGDLDDGDPDQPFLGTVAYLAPERLLGRPAVPATDVYALGLIIYRCLTADFPWPGRGQDEMIANHCLRAPAPLPPIDGLPDGVANLVARCLRKTPTDRPDAAEVARELAAAARVRVVLPGDDPHPSSITNSWAVVASPTPADGDRPPVAAPPPAAPASVSPASIPPALIPPALIPPALIPPAPDAPVSGAPVPGAPVPPVPPGSGLPGSGPAVPGPPPKAARQLPRLVGAAVLGVGVAALILLGLTTWGQPPAGSPDRAEDTIGRGPAAPVPTPGITRAATVAPGGGPNATGGPTAATGGAPTVGPDATDPGLVPTAVVTAGPDTGGPVVTTPAGVAPAYACNVGFKVTGNGKKAKAVARNTGSATFVDWRLLVTVSDGSDRRTLTLTHPDDLPPGSRATIRLTEQQLSGYAMVDAVLAGTRCGFDPPPADAE